MCAPLLPKAVSRSWLLVKEEWSFDLKRRLHDMQTEIPYLCFVLSVRKCSVQHFLWQLLWCGEKSSILDVCAAISALVASEGS